MVQSLHSGLADPGRTVVTIDRTGYTARGAAADFMAATDREVIMSGPAGSGKTIAGMTKLYRLAFDYPGCRLLVLRQTARSLTSSALVTFRQRVLQPGDGVKFYSARADKAAQYEFPTGSIMAVGGMDDPAKVLSTEFDVIYFVEATETTLEAWETLSSRLRSNVLPYQQLAGDCNPAQPSHWIKERANAGTLRMLESRHVDNPTLWDDGASDWTPFGRQYIETLDRLTGTRRERLRYGRWVSAEGAVYESYDPRVHLVTADELIAWGVLNPDGRPNRTAIRRAWAGVDFGWTNPGSINALLEDGDGRLYRVAEVYQTQRQVDPWWVDELQALEERYGPFDGVACDPAGAAYIDLLRERGFEAFPANNAVGPGIQAVQARFATATDGFPRLFICRSDPAGFDQSLVERHLPCCTEQELEGYIWNPSLARKEEPVKVNDHGCDSLRYGVMQVDEPRSRYDSF